MKGLTGKNAMITGASSGIGQATLAVSAKQRAVRLAQEGCNITITGQTLFIDGGLTLYADFREAWSA